MDIKFEKLNCKNDEQLNILLKWECDKELNHFIIPNRDKNKEIEYPTFEIFKKRFEENLIYTSGIYIIYDGIKPIGNFSLQADPEHLIKKVKGTAWLGLSIGEKEYWGTGAAAEAMAFFERESVSFGLKRVELGVFEFNIRAQKFYKKMGYEEIGRLKNFTFWNGQYWDDIRMEKSLLL